MLGQASVCVCVCLREVWSKFKLDLVWLVLENGWAGHAENTPTCYWYIHTSSYFVHCVWAECRGTSTIEPAWWTKWATSRCWVSQWMLRFALDPFGLPLSRDNLLHKSENFQYDKLKQHDGSCIHTHSPPAPPIPPIPPMPPIPPIPPIIPIWSRLPCPGQHDEQTLPSPVMSEMLNWAVSLFLKFFSFIKITQAGNGHTLPCTYFLLFICQLQYLANLDFSLKKRGFPC